MELLGHMGVDLTVDEKMDIEVDSRSINSLIWALLLIAIIGPGVFAVKLRSGANSAPPRSIRSPTSTMPAGLVAAVIASSGSATPAPE